MAGKLEVLSNDSLPCERDHLFHKCSPHIIVKLCCINRGILPWENISREGRHENPEKKHREGCCGESRKWSKDLWTKELPETETERIMVDDLATLRWKLQLAENLELRRLRRREKSAEIVF